MIAVKLKRRPGAELPRSAGAHHIAVASVTRSPDEGCLWYRGGLRSLAWTSNSSAPGRNEKTVLVAKMIPATLRRHRDGTGCTRVTWSWLSFTPSRRVLEALLFLAHTTHISTSDMTRPSNEARLQLRDARDALCVSQLFANHPFTANDAINALEHSHVTPDPALIRVLLQNGADVNVLDIRNVRWSKHPTELLRLLAEHGYDFKPKGHRVLQSVSGMTASREQADTY